MTTERFWSKVDDEEATYARLRHAADSGDVDAKIEAGRALARAQIASRAERSEGVSIVPPERIQVPATERRTACGVAWGTLLRFDEVSEQWVCPSCGAPEGEPCQAVT